MTTTITSTPATQSVRSSSAKGAAIGVGIGWILTTIVYATASPIRVKTGWQVSGAKMTVIEYLLTVAISVSLGALVLIGMTKRSANGFRPWQVVAAVFAVVSALPLWQLDIPTSSKSALTIMHLLTGAAAIVGQRIARPK
jgi:Family of unknown function (DUF6069)